MVGDRPETDGLLAATLRLSLRARLVRRHPPGKLVVPTARPRSPLISLVWPTSCSREATEPPGKLRCMTGSPVLKRLLDAGMQFTEMSQKNAEKLVSDFVKAGQLRRKDAEKTVQRLVERGRATTEHVVCLIQAEVAKQLGKFAERLDDIEARVEDVASNVGLGSKASAAKAAAQQATGPSGVARVVTRKAPAKKAAVKKAAKKAPAKKAPAKKKTAAKKASVKKAPAKKSARVEAPASGCRHGSPRAGAQHVQKPRVRSRPTASWSTDRSPTSRHGSVDPGDAVVLHGPPARFVSRGGDKLDAALDAFGIDVVGCRVLDAGASTGGFTDCLLQRGAGHVVALDVGHGQLHPKIRGDQRVCVLERFHVRDLTVDAIGGEVDLVVADLSFISIIRALPSLMAVCRAQGQMVLLVKPQFEAGKGEVDRGSGVITDPAVHQRVCDEVSVALTENGCDVLGWIDSPITGAEGNREFLVHARVGRSGSAP